MHWINRSLWRDLVLYAIRPVLRKLASADLAGVRGLPLVALACVALLLAVTLEQAPTFAPSSKVRIPVTGTVAIGERIGQWEVSSPWGPRRCNGCSPFHRGVDVAAPVGSPVFALKQSRVWCKGDFVVQQSPVIAGYSVEVLHLSSCKSGKYSGGEVVAYSGTAGTGPHYHLQVRDEKVYASGRDGRIPPSREILRAVIARSVLN